ncbi:MAG: 2-phospho-L-lactate guanylyltransferase [Anaerolineales bacterium]|nr:2-phospho-L-lactate guanylyltransferase [Anaerolineales bacterium]
MPLWAILPVKPFRQAKSRLAGVLTPAQRLQLTRDLLTRTLDVLAQVPAVGRRLVISRDQEALALARRHHGYTMTESGTGFLDLNVALRRATLVARGFGATGVVVLPADLPRLRPADVEALIGTDLSAPAVAIAPDRHGAGTNGLLVRPPGLLAYAFGEGSYEAHLAQARAVQVEPRLVHVPGLAFDLDTADDWALNQEYTSAHIPPDPTRRPTS